MVNEKTEVIRIDAASVLAQVIDNEVMIIDVRLGNYYSLNGVAATIWQALSQPCRVDESGSICAAKL